MGKEKYECVSPEDVELGVDYALTISPKDDLQFFGQNSNNRVISFMEAMTPICYKNIYADYYKLVMEISKGGRLHFHGWIRWDDKDSLKTFFLTIKKLQNVGTYAIKPMSATDISDKYKTWSDYVFKQKWLWDNKYIINNEMQVFTKKEMKKSKIIKIYAA